jgi:hypothetical protein
MTIEHNLWFDATIMISIFHVGNLYLGHFEAHKPTWKRLLKTALFLAFVIGMSSIGLRVWAWSIIAVLGTGMFAYVHGYWLPKHGVNGWTGEPKDTYYQLIRFKKQKDSTTNDLDNKKNE